MKVIEVESIVKTTDSAKLMCQIMDDECWTFPAVRNNFQSSPIEAITCKRDVYIYQSQSELNAIPHDVQFNGVSVNR